MARTPIYAAGGIVVRGRARLLVAVVQRSKDGAWVLPRGKLKRDENPVVGARREVVEETGHRVRVHEFLGAITYRARGRPKVVQFWRMQAYERPSRDVMSDIIAVDWLPYSQAVRRLSYPLEKLFLQHAGRRVLKHRKHHKKRKARARRKAKASTAGRRSSKVRARKARPHRRSLTRAGRAHARPRQARTSIRRSRHVSPPRIAAAKQATPSKSATPAKRPTMLQRMLGLKR
jgi:8-oxo-dGTP diphosphatase